MGGFFPPRKDFHCLGVSCSSLARWDPTGSLRQTMGCRGWRKPRRNKEETTTQEGSVFISPSLDIFSLKSTNASLRYKKKAPRWSPCRRLRRGALPASHPGQSLALRHGGSGDSQGVEGTPVRKGMTPQPGPPCSGRGTGDPNAAGTAWLLVANSGTFNQPFSAGNRNLVFTRGHDAAYVHKLFRY